MNNHTRRWFARAALVAALAFGGASLAQGAVVPQIGTAIEHAGFAADAADHASAMRHLGHVLNCLAGPDGEGFDGSWGHPCGSLGAGILVDLAADPAAADVLVLARGAHALALDGVGESGIAAVQAAAMGVRALLSVLLERLG